jgi:hypothetical protein
MSVLQSVQPGRETTRMSEGDQLAQATRPASDLRGLIDNATTDRIYGWAWDSAYPGHRVAVELRLDGETVASTIADIARPDLAANGVGDGCHAFDFTLLPEWFERRTELSVMALGGDGAGYPITVRLRRPDDSQVATALQRAVEAVAAEQQGIRGEFAAFRARAEQLPDAEAVAAIARNNTALQTRLDELELWLSRLDAKLAQAGLAPEAAAPGRLDPWQAVLIAVLASAVSAALALAAANFWS